MSLNICGLGHEDITFDGRNCPLCTALDEIESLKDLVTTMEDRSV
jgi:hypothetical protein